MSWNETTHTLRCEYCDYTAAPANHNFINLNEPVVSSDGKGHVSQMCENCGYTSGDGEAHEYNETGACTVCKFLPILEGETGNLYEDLKTALDADETELTLVSYATGESANIVKANLDFDTDKDITLNMGGCTLTGEGNSVLTVSNGTLTVKGDATISNTGTTTDLAAPAIEVTGGKVTFEGKVTATGGTYTYGNRIEQKPAVYATGGSLTFNGDLDLLGGLKVEGDATLTSLKKGTFRISDNVQNTNRLSVEGSKNYKYVDA